MRNLGSNKEILPLSAKYLSEARSMRITSIYAYSLKPCRRRLTMSIATVDNKVNPWRLYDYCLLCCPALIANHLLYLRTHCITNDPLLKQKPILHPLIIQEVWGRNSREGYKARGGVPFLWGYGKIKRVRTKKRAAVCELLNTHESTSGEQHATVCCLHRMG